MVLTAGTQESVLCTLGPLEEACNVNASSCRWEEELTLFYPPRFFPALKKLPAITDFLGENCPLLKRGSTPPYTEAYHACGHPTRLRPCSSPAPGAQPAWSLAPLRSRRCPSPMSSPRCCGCFPCFCSPPVPSEAAAGVAPQAHPASLRISSQRHPAEMAGVRGTKPSLCLF